MLTKEAFAVRSITESFSAAGTCNRERASQIAGGKTGREVSTQEVLMQETRIEAVSCADRVNGGDLECRTVESLSTASSNRSFRTQFYDN